MRLNTCRGCGEQEFDGNGRRLFKTGRRHYYHARCGFFKLGTAFLDRIPTHELGDLPYRVIEDAGLIEEVKRRMREAYLAGYEDGRKRGD